MTEREKPIQQHYGKQTILNRWSGQEPNQPIRVTPIETKHKGSTFDRDTIRLTGSQEFIDSVLSNLQGLLDFDGGSSRLQVTYTETVTRIKDPKTGNLVAGDLTGAWAFYAHAHDRGTGEFRGKRGQGKAKQQTTETTQETLEDEPSDDQRKPDKPKNGLVELPAKANRINAGLTMKAKPKVKEPTTAFAIATKDEDGGWTWAEPSGEKDMIMDTYPDLEMCNDAIKSLKKQSAFKKAALQPVEVTNDNGKLSFKEV